MTKNFAIVGGGPAGLIAAEILAEAGHAVTVYDQKPSVGRKFLMAGHGGLNLTHSEGIEAFTQRYGEAATWMAPYLSAFSPTDLLAWCHAKGIETFVGSSGRIFPVGMKASPLLRAWLKRLGTLGVAFIPGARFCGWDGDALLIETQDGVEKVRADATLLALGGASWPRLGSDGGWVSVFQKAGIEVAPLKPSNCGFVVPWTDVFKERFAGQVLKPVTLRFGESVRQGEVLLTERGIEGSLVYAFSSLLRDEIEASGSAVLHLDLRPGLEFAILEKQLGDKRGGLSFSNLLRKGVGLSAAASGLLREVMISEKLPAIKGAALARLIKNCPLRLAATTGIERAISSAGGIKREALSASLMLRAMPDIFVAGEMIDWEAPTGGYLLQGCFSTGVAAARGMLARG